MHRPYYSSIDCVNYLKIKIRQSAEKFMKGYAINIEKETLVNENFRKVLYTSEHSQLVLMNLKPKEEIGMEVHPDNDQFFRFEKGQGKCIIDGNEYELKDGTAIVVPAGAEHNIINTSASDELKLYTIYSPAHHKDGVVRMTKEEAEANGPEFDGVTTE
jgi:mannose-6-phosphate isomerase-like protein (cupin superfamily)